ncbi:hypothetical protein HK097_007211 [Rhizophlyctis rosea]|uniref:Uncharacterized protein n=1 Tax=Rhizophlyctis rosea TaxID=64517 RepID=A0AAD5SKE6_9FUNG|nr:hypothetical protein HK097_007211 [Rhizophlyctis rosea]
MRTSFLLAVALATSLVAAQKVENNQNHQASKNSANNHKNTNAQNSRQRTNANNLHLKQTKANEATQSNFVNNQLSKNNFNTKNDHAAVNFNAQQNHNAAKQAGNNKFHNGGGHGFGLGTGKWRRDVEDGVAEVAREKQISNNNNQASRKNANNNLATNAKNSHQATNANTLNKHNTKANQASKKNFANNVLNKSNKNTVNDYNAKNVQASNNAHAAKKGSSNNNFAGNFGGDYGGMRAGKKWKRATEEGEVEVAGQKQAANNNHHASKKSTNSNQQANAVNSHQANQKEQSNLANNQLQASNFNTKNDHAAKNTKASNNLNAVIKASNQNNHVNFGLGGHGKGKCLLGVAPNADEATCKEAYKKLARKLHPDKNAGADTTARFQQVSAAYERTRTGHNFGEEVPDAKPAAGSSQTPRSQAYKSPFSFTSSNVNYGFRGAKPTYSSGSRSGSSEDFAKDFGTGYGAPYTGEGYGERLMREEEERLKKSEASRSSNRKKEDAQNRQRREEWAEGAQQESDARARCEQEEAEKEEDEHEANERHEQLKKKQEARSRAFAAAREGHLEILKGLIRKGVNPAGYEYLDPAIHKSRRAMGETMLHIAARRNDTALAEFLLNGASTEQTDEEGRTALHVAALNGATDVALLLIVDYHCSVESRDRDGSTPLVLAAQRGHVETFDMLIDKGARISTRDNSARTIKQKVQQSFNSAIQTPALRERLQLIQQRIESFETRHVRNRRRREEEESLRRAEEAEKKRAEAERDRDYWMRQARRLEEKIRKQDVDADMGFKSENATSAARACGGDMTRAVEQLLKDPSSTVPSQRSKTSRRKKPPTPSFSTPNIDAMLNGTFEPYSRQASMESLPS